MPPREAALARGFVLGEDEGIDPRTVTDFRRAGLSHLLAVSGQNVALLALLAMPVLAALGLPLRARLLWVLGLIAIYVPLAGAGPVDPAGGGDGRADRRGDAVGPAASRLYGLALAAAVTLAIDPGIAGRRRLAAELRRGPRHPPLGRPLRGDRRPARARGARRRALAEGDRPDGRRDAGHRAADRLPLRRALDDDPGRQPPGAAGDRAGDVARDAGRGVGQVPGSPVAAVDSLWAPLLAYIAQVAAWCGRPSWACVEVHSGSPAWSGPTRRSPRPRFSARGRPAPPHRRCSSAPA